MSKKQVLQSRLADGAAEMGIRIDEQQLQGLLAYLALLRRWNRVYNLTAVKSDTGILTRHLLDSLSVVPYLQGKKVVDIGSGAGLPGVPVAVACPEKQITLLDSNAKRCRFLRQVQAELNMQNVKVVQQRAEEYRPAEKFDNLLSRAFSSLQDFIACSKHLLADGGQVLAMKGVWPGEEAAELPTGFIIKNVVKLTVPGLPEQRHLVICEQSDQM